MNKTIKLGAGAGFSGDRIDPAQQLVEHADLDYLIFECLGERTVAAGELRRRSDKDSGFDPLLEARMRACLPGALEHGTRIITNAGAANPRAAAALVFKVAQDLKLPRAITIAVIEGDSVLPQVVHTNPLIWETNSSVSDSDGDPVSAHAYVGIEALLPALASGADVIIAGRVADPSLYLAPMVHEFGWSVDDYHLLGAGTAIGHLLECAGQLTGGYYADPIKKPVPNMAGLGFPYAEVAEDGTAVFKKLQSAGGILTVQTCTEQLLYEVSDPSAYITPDVVADFSNIQLTQVAAESVAIRGGTGHPRTETLKVTLGYQSGWMGEGQISYSGPRAFERAQLAAEIVVERLVQIHKIPQDVLNVELIGAGSAFRGLSAFPADPLEIRVRVAGIVESQERAAKIGWEVESLYTNGPAAGGGARQYTKELLSIRSALLPRDLVSLSTEILEVPTS
ncbi:hypothetical protein N24_2387 [Corynebacterium suranareeae]|uniref:Acyclic terpene utilisation N-terminal domain-containing protein n=1 Tax=Corynebacterium suranareeae TaxID=2506452 RepID=A0A160PRE2_9CORY|nr:acyclic terpene utilization AtuA family protein [Corynebacterium suranareeae]BAU96649.1 hypothetical protein N24_2387 [Corynebacterium suranareeae]